MSAPVERPKSRFSRPTLIILGVGLFLIVAYFLLTGLHIGKFGSESDIGGGLILLAGLPIAALGAVMAIIEFKRR